MKLSGLLSLCALLLWAGLDARGLAEGPRTGAQAASSEARGSTASVDILATGRALDALDLARVAEEVGDARLLAALTAPEDRAAAALAARAAAHARAPEALIVPLAKLACGRDPALAPEAAHALLELADLLSASQLEAREVLERDLEQARQGLACRTQKPLPRADIALALAQLDAALAALLR